VTFRTGCNADCVTSSCARQVWLVSTLGRRLGGREQWRLLWLTQANFMVGIVRSGVQDDRPVLLCAIASGDHRKSVASSGGFTDSNLT